MTLHEAYTREKARGRQVIYEAIEEECHLCHKSDELRAGVCFECMELVETDMIEAWDRKDPTNRWPYVWCGKPAGGITEEQVIEAQKLAEDMSR